MIAIKGVDTIGTIPTVESPSDLTDFIDTLSNGSYTFVLGAANALAAGLPRGTCILHVDVNSSNFIMVTAMRFDSPNKDYRLYKVSGAWQSEWTECAFLGGGNKCLIFSKVKMGVAA